MKLFAAAAKRVPEFEIAVDGLAYLLGVTVVGIILGALKALSAITWTWASVTLVSVLWIPTGTLLALSFLVIVSLLNALSDWITR